MLLFARLLAFRLANALLVQTFFNPDEYWQGLEPAHAAVFGYGYLTWEWRERIRSPLHPLLFVPVYELLQWAGWDATPLLPLAPRLLQAVFAAAGDLFTIRLAERLYGKGSAAASWTAILTVCSWFHFFAITRTLANSLETVLTVVALAYWPWTANNKVDYGGLCISLCVAAVSTVVRPTSLLMWLPLGIHLLWTAPSWPDRARIVFAVALPITLLAGAFVLALDSWYFGEPTFSMWNFLRFNVLQNLSVFYGSHPWHWYFSQGVPFVATTLVPLALWGYANAPAMARTLGNVAMVVVGLYSLLAHKEFRFIHPTLPIIIVLAGRGAQTVLDRYKGATGKAILGTLVILQVIMAGYFSLVHQRGVIDVVEYLRQQETSSILFVMPCHSTPWQSHLHHPNTTLRFITCEPPSPGTELATYQDESDLFYADPSSGIKNLLEEGPTAQNAVVVLFQALQPVAAPILSEKGFVECARFFNSHFTDDSRRAGDVIVYKL